MYLKNNIILCIPYESLRRVTHNFTREVTRINCAKINELKLCDATKCLYTALKAYFPFAKIHYL